MKASSSSPVPQDASLVVVILLLLPACLGAGRYDALFVFGDSYMDTGNSVIVCKAINMTTWADLLPNGQTFFHRPTGRISDGRLIVDFLAEEFGLPLLPPYLAVAPGNRSSLRQGVDFSVGGASAFSIQYVNGKLLNNTMSVQLGWFDELKPSLCSCEEECRALFGNALFVFGEFGVNDYYYISSTKGVEGAKPYVPQVVDLIRGGVEVHLSPLNAHLVFCMQKLIGDGATTVLVPGLPPSGCAPSRLTEFPSSNASDYDRHTGCLTAMNQLSIYHNKLLLQTLEQLRRQHPHVRIIYADYYRPLMNFIENPVKYGFRGGADVLRSCCGSGGKYNFNASAFCGMPGVEVCPDPSAFIIWDGIHYTEAVYRYITNWWLNGPYAHPPVLDQRLSVLMIDDQ